MWTAAEQFTERKHLPVPEVALAMLSGYSARNDLWPRCAVSQSSSRAIVARREVHSSASVIARQDAEI
jgi:hypothetical protein